MSRAAFKLDLNESFPRLARPPIIEAVIHWQARAEKPLELDSLRKSLSERLPGYPKSEVIKEFGFMALMSDQDAAPVVQHNRQDFAGLRMTSDDGRNVVQFKRDELIFSRIKEYERWEPFTAASKEVWQLFLESAAPIEVQRLGVRFINHLPDATPDNLREWLREPPTCPSNLPLREFVYRSTFDVPDQPFGIRVVKVMQPPGSGLRQSSGLFLDIDVYSTTAMPTDNATLDEALVKIRWLKNKIFFTLLSETAWKAFSTEAS